MSSIQNATKAPIDEATIVLAKAVQLTGQSSLTLHFGPTGPAHGSAQVNLCRPNRSRDSFGRFDRKDEQHIYAEKGEGHEVIPDEFRQCDHLLR